MNLPTTGLDQPATSFSGTTGLKQNPALACSHGEEGCLELRSNGVCASFRRDTWSAMIHPHPECVLLTEQQLHRHRMRSDFQIPALLPASQCQAPLRRRSQQGAVQDSGYLPNAPGNPMQFGCPSDYSPHSCLHGSME